MLLEYGGQDGDRLRVEWPGGMFTVALDGNGNAMGLHDQDYIHNGKNITKSVIQFS